MVAHHRLEVRARPLLRPGQADAGRDGVRQDDARGRGDEEGRRRDGRGRHLPPDAGRRLLRRIPGRPRGSRSPTRSSVVPARDRSDLHRLRLLHDRVPAQRQEHPGEELPLPRGAERRRRAPADHGHRRTPPRRRRLRGDRPLDQGEAVAQQRRQDVHCRPGGVLGRRPRHPAAAPPAEGAGLAAGDLRPARRASPAPTPRRSSGPRPTTTPSTGPRAWRSPRQLPPRRAHPHRAGPLRPRLAT